MNLNKQLTEATMAALRKRNERRVAEVKAAMGDKWLLHPTNRKERSERKEQPGA